MQQLCVQISKRAQCKLSCRVWCYSNREGEVTEEEGAQRSCRLWCYSNRGREMTEDEGLKSLVVYGAIVTVVK